MQNSWNGQGRLTRDIELKHTPGDVSYAQFTIACDRDFKPKDGNREADFIDIMAWRGIAEFASKYFHKGDMMVVTGRIQTRNYEDRNGNKRKATEIVAENINFGGARRSDTTAKVQPEEAQEPGPGGFINIPDNVDDEGLPFD